MQTETMRNVSLFKFPNFKAAFMKGNFSNLVLKSRYFEENSQSIFKSDFL